MAGPSPKELRERVITAYHNGEGSQRELAARFCIERSTLEKWLKLEAETGALDPRPMGGARHPRKVDAEGESFVRQVLADVPDSTIPELVAAYEAEFGRTMDNRTMGRALSRMGYTKKKGSGGRLWWIAPT